MSEPDRIAVVTGAASGIGLAIAQRLADDGDRVAIWDLDLDAANEAADAINASGGTAAAFDVDVANRDQIDAAREATIAALGTPTILVCNAGKDSFGSFLKLSIEDWQQQLDINLTGTFHCCQALVPGMIDAKWGRIITISSSACQGGREYMSAYVASKSGVIGLTQSIARELGPKGITANTIPPEFIDTPMLRKAEADGMLGPGVESHAQQTPVRRAGLPSDIAHTVSFLASQGASYVTGQIIGVNGGRKG